VRNEENYFFTFLSLSAKYPFTCICLRLPGTVYMYTVPTDTHLLHMILCMFLYHAGAYRYYRLVQHNHVTHMYFLHLAAVHVYVYRTVSIFIIFIFIYCTVQVHMYPSYHVRYLWYMSRATCNISAPFRFPLPPVRKGYHVFSKLCTHTQSTTQQQTDHS